MDCEGGEWRDTQTDQAARGPLSIVAYSVCANSQHGRTRRSCTGESTTGLSKCRRQVSHTRPRVPHKAPTECHRRYGIVGGTAHRVRQIRLESSPRTGHVRANQQADAGEQRLEQ
jgi:hypothetical protein